MEIINSSQIEMVPLASLKEHPRNPNRGDVAIIQESIAENGFYGAVVAQKSTGYILAGNHRFKAVKAASGESLPIVWVDCDDHRALKILLADNRTAELASRDDEQLADLLKELNEWQEGIVGTGYDEEALNLLLEKLSDSPPDVEFKEFDESVVDDVEFIECPECGHKWPK